MPPYALCHIVVVLHITLYCCLYVIICYYNIIIHRYYHALQLVVAEVVGVAGFVGGSVSRSRSGSSSNGNGSSNGFSTKRIEDWHGKEYGVVWKMDDELRRTALALLIN